jgi:PAS domain S-box-containing protein
MGEWSFTPVAIVYFLAAGISFLLSYLGWRMKSARGALFFSFMMLMASVWIFAYTLDVFNNNFAWKMLMLKLEYLGMAFSVFLWVVFVAVYTQYDNWLKKPFLILLAVIPIFSLINIFLAPGDNLIHSNYHLEMVDGVTVTIKTAEIGFYLWASYAYLALTSGMIMLIIRILMTPNVLHKQLSLIVPAVLIIIFSNLFSILEINPIAPYDPTPISLVIVGVLFLSSMRFYKFLDVMPVAHNLIFKNMYSGVIIIDSIDRIIEINPAAENILNYSDKEVSGKNILEILPECEQLLLTDIGVTEIKTEIKLGLANRVFEMKINSIIDNNEVATGKIILLFDITEQKAAISELDAYARTVAHDLKNPLSNIIGHAHLLNSECSNNPESHLYLNGIIDGAMRMNSIIEGLLLLAKVRNVENIKLNELDTQQIVYSAVDRLTLEMKERNAHIVFPDRWINACGYSIWVEEVWTNLISNAIKYGGENPRIEIDCYEKDESVFYTVKDFGVGINFDEQENVFVEFSRLSRSTGDAEGHGIGLAIVKRIIKKLGGVVGVNSKLGEGSVFYFSLPVCK